MRLRGDIAGWLLMGTALLGLRGVAQLGIDEINAREDARLEQRGAAIRDYLYAPALVATGKGGDSVAFPGAVGYGATALTGCVKSKVYVHRVTPATLFDSLANQHPDTLDVYVFTAGGWYDLPAAYQGSHDCVYIAGQTAPGSNPGFWKSNDFIGMRDDSKDVVYRGLTFASRGRLTCTQTPSITIRDARRAIITETEHYWYCESAIDALPVYNPDTVLAVTYQRILFGPPNGPNYVCCSIREVNSVDHLNTDIDSITYAYNVWHSIGWRQPSLSCKLGDDQLHVRRVNVAANAWYNGGYQANAMAAKWNADIIDSYVKSGPWSRDESPYYNWGASVWVGADCDSGTGIDSTKLYVERIIGGKNRDTLATADSLWADGGGHQEVSCYFRDCDTGGGGDPRDSLGAQIKRDTALTPPFIPVPRINPYTLKDELFGNGTDSAQVGIYRYIQCDGTWAFRSDSMHNQLMKHARDSTWWGAKIDSAGIDQRGKWTKPTGTPCTDADNDGMPQAFENLYAPTLDDTDPNDNDDDPDGDGWTNIEEYVNGTDPTTPTGADGSEGAGAGSATYGSGRNVYKWRLYTDTTDEGRIYKRPNPDSAAALVDGFRLVPRPNHDTAMVVTCDTLAGWSALDSAVLDDTLSAWGLSPSPSLRNVPVSGC